MPPVLNLYVFALNNSEHNALSNISIIENFTDNILQSLDYSFLYTVRNLIRRPVYAG